MSLCHHHTTQLQDLSLALTSVADHASCLCGVQGYSALLRACITGQLEVAHVLLSRANGCYDQLRLLVDMGNVAVRVYCLTSRVAA